MYAYLLYDAIWLYALALNKSLAEEVSENDSLEISKRMFNITVPSEYVEELLRCTFPEKRSTMQVFVTACK